MSHTNEGLGLTSEHIATIEALARNDVAVHAFLALKCQAELEWSDVLTQMVVHLANEKAQLAARLTELIAMSPPVQRLIKS